MVFPAYWQSFEQTLEGILLHVEHYSKTLVQIVDRVQRQLVETSNERRWGQAPIEFTTLQWTLFKVLLILLFTTVLLIAYAWRVYGEVITDKFVRPSKSLDPVVKRSSAPIYLFTYLLMLVFLCNFGVGWKGTLKEIEELKLSVAKLKLPKEHTPRI